MTRVCVYRFDDGAFRRHMVQYVTDYELYELYATQYYRVIVLDPDDFEGRGTPNIYPEHME